MKKYNIIYADPPWSFKNYNDKTATKYVGNVYPVMNTKDICKLPIKDLADENCVLLIWITFPKLQEVFNVINNWGFEYKTCGFVWVKKNKKNINSNFWGMGYYTRSNAELCLLATKGKPLKRLSHKIHSIIEYPITKHSEKPDTIRDKIVELFGDLPRIELFAREKTDGWDVWGNEVDSDIDISCS